MVARGREGAGGFSTDQMEELRVGAGQGQGQGLTEKHPVFLA